MIGCGMLRAALRGSVVVLVVLGAVPLLLSSAGHAEPRAPTLFGPCEAAFVDGTVENRTTFRMDPYFFDYAPTNTVCNGLHPGSVRPGSFGHWRVGA